jgi:hypothetical protein
MTRIQRWICPMIECYNGFGMSREQESESGVSGDAGGFKLSWALSRTAMLLLAMVAVIVLAGPFLHEQGRYETLTCACCGLKKSESVTSLCGVTYRHSVTYETNRVSRALAVVNCPHEWVSSSRSVMEGRLFGPKSRGSGSNHGLEYLEPFCREENFVREITDTPNHCATWRALAHYFSTNAPDTDSLSSWYSDSWHKPFTNWMADEGIHVAADTPRQ